jgi:hypothetical protein
MKKKNLIIFGLTIIIAAAAFATTIVYSKYLANEVVAYAKTFTLDTKLDGQNRRTIDTVYASLTLSSGTVGSVSVTDGALSTGSFTVASLTNIAGAYATNTITVSSTATLKNTYVDFNGKRLRNGYEWKTKATVALTAVDIARIANYLTDVSASTTSAGVVTLTARTKGTAANAFTLSEYGTGLAVGAATFSGGLNPAIVTVNGTAIPVTVGVDTTTGTAAGIAAAINSHASLLNLVTASTNSAVVNIAANVVGVNAYTTVSNFSGITAASAAMTGGSATAITTTKTITKTAHGLTTGTPVLYSSDTVTLDGLTDQTTYYASNVAANTFQLATTSTGAIAGLSITISATPSTAGPHTFTFAPTAPAGDWGFIWKTSDDNTNWTTMSVSSVTFGTPYTTSTTSWDLGTIGHRYLRGDVVKGTGGSVKVELSVTGRNSN